MSVALTGATGFFGRALLDVVQSAGRPVRALVRRAEDEAWLRARDVIPIRGDLSVPGTYAELVSPGDTVIHAAARVDLVGRWSDFHRGTVATTRNLLNAVLPRGPARFVYVSSAAVYGPPARGEVLSAARCPARPTSDNLYGRAKRAAERLVQRMCAQAGCPWTIVRLAFLYGPGNRVFLDRLRLVHQRGRLFLVGDGTNRIATLYRDDAAEAVWLAATRPACAGRIYDAASDEPVTQADFINAHAALLGIGPVCRHIDPRLAYVGGWLAEFGAALTGQPVALSRALVRLMSADQIVDAGRLRADTGWQPRVQFAEGMRRTRAWYTGGTGAADHIVRVVPTGSARAPHRAVRRPNILLIVVDCGRADCWLGSGRTTRTPTVDALCAAGVSWPVTIVEKACTTPSFASLLTGLYSPRHGVHMVWGDRLPGHVKLLTEVLATEGYHTYAEVTGPLLPEMGLARGFERYEYRAPSDYLHTRWGDELVGRLRGGHYRAPWFLLLHLWELHPPRQVSDAFDRPAYGRNAYERAVSSLDAQLARVLQAVDPETLVIFTADHGEKLSNESYRPGTAVAYVREALRLDTLDGPVPFHVAHWAGPSVLQQLYGAGAALLRDLRLTDIQARARADAWSRLRDRLELLLLTPWLRTRDLAALVMPGQLTAMLQRSGLLDAQRSQRKVERFRRWLGDDRLLDLHLRMWANSYKRNLDEGHMLHVYDFLVRVPLVMRWTGRLPAGASFRRMVRQVDVFPTLLELLGIRVPGDGLDGTSFRSLLDGDAWEPQPAFLSVSGLPRDLELRGVRTETHKYTYGPHNPDLPAELYDLRQDPGETRNLANAEPGLCTSLRELAERFVPADPSVAAQPVPLTAEDQARVEQHLRDLGYL